MTFNEFADEIRNAVQETLGDDFDVKIMETEKNNGIKLTGVQIKSEDTNVAPVIYLEEFYQEFCEGKPTGEIVNDILRVHSEHRMPGIDVTQYTNFEWVKDKLTYKLVNTEKNAELLKQIPNDPVLDMSMVYIVDLGTSEHGKMTILVRNEHVERWGISHEELKKIAMDNAPKKEKYEFRSMSEVLAAMTGNEIPDDGFMYVLTNETKTNGAAVILYEGVLDEIEKKIGSFYIIPSSIHETIVIPCKGTEADRIRPMIGEVNDSEVSDQEVLSYSLYQYDHENGLKIA
jgi:hypothetical protein